VCARRREGRRGEGEALGTILVFYLPPIWKGEEQKNVYFMRSQ